MKQITRIISALNESLVKKSLGVLVLRVLGSLLQILVLLTITNFAEEKIVGQYNYFNSTIVLLSAITLLGMNSSFLQFSGKLEANNEFGKIVYLYKRKFTILFVMYIVLLGLFLLLSRVLHISYFQDSDVIYVLDKVFLALLPFSITLLNLEVLRALNFLYLSEGLRNVGRFGLFMIFVVVIVLADRIQFLFDAFVLSFALLAVFSFIVIVKGLKKQEKISDKKGISYAQIIRVSFPMSFSLISLLVMQSFDVYVLEKYFSFTTVAYYGIAIKISAVVGIILTSINATIAPWISKLFFQDNMDELNGVIKKATTLNVVLSVPLILFIILFSDLILSFFGPNYVLAKQALYIILIGQIVNTLCGPVGLYLNMTGRQNFFQRVLVIALILNIIMNLVLIPKYEMIGAAITTSLSFTLWNLSGLFYVLKKDKINLSIFGSRYKQLK